MWLDVASAGCMYRAVGGLHLADGLSLWQAVHSTEFRSLSVSFGDFRRTLKTIIFERY